MAEILAVLKLFLNLYPLLKSISTSVGGKIEDLRIEHNQKKISIVFDNISEDDATQSDIQDQARRLNDIFRKN